MIKILMICHGNICRSPMAQYVMQHLVDSNGLHDNFEIDSAATSREEIGNGIHQITIPDDNNTKNGVPTLTDSSNTDKYIANVEYLNKSIGYAKNEIDNKLQSYLNNREWSKLVTGAYATTSGLASQYDIKQFLAGIVAEPPKLNKCPAVARYAARPPAR